MQTLVKGDATSTCIAAASVIAKVCSIVWQSWIESCSDASTGAESNMFATCLQGGLRPPRTADLKDPTTLQQGDATRWKLTLPALQHLPATFSQHSQLLAVWTHLAGMLLLLLLLCGAAELLACCAAGDA
jgi:hypothetical protein